MTDPHLAIKTNARETPTSFLKFRNGQPLLIDEVVVVRSGSDARNIRVDGSVVVPVATLTKPIEQSVLGSFKAPNRSVLVRSRMIHVQSNPLAEKRRAEAELQLPSFKLFEKHCTLNKILSMTDDVYLFEDGTECALGVRHR